MTSQQYEALKRDLEEKEYALAELAVKVAILRKKPLGVVGKIARRWLESDQKVEIALSIKAAKDKGISIIRVCRMWAMNRRRFSRWRSKLARGQSLENAKPGPKNPVHKPLPAETRVVLQMARAQQYLDLSHRMLTVTGLDLKLFFVSFSLVYRILRSEGLMSMRGKHRWPFLRR